MATQISAQDIASGAITSASLGTGSVTASALDTSLPFQQNILLNGGFDLWSNGITWPVNQNLSVPMDTSDYWLSSYNGTAVFSYTQNSATQESGRYAMDIIVTSVGTTTRLRICQFSQGQSGATGVLNPYIYSGKTLTLTARVKCPSVGKVSLLLEDGAGSTESAYNTTTGAYETLTVTRTISANTNTLNVYIGYNSQNPVTGTTTIDSAMLTIGSTALAFVPSDNGLDKLKGFNPLAGARNLLTNGGAEIWQRGTSFTNPIAGTYAADGWQNSNNGNTASFIVSKETTITDGSPSSLKWALTATGGTTVFAMRMYIEAAQYIGQTVTLRARVRVDSGGSGFVNVNLNDNGGSTATVGSLQSGAATWETLIVQKTVAAGTTSMFITIGFNNVAGVAYLDNFMLVVGNQPIPFVPMHPQEDLARCQRYFQILGGVANKTIGAGQAYSTVNAEIPQKFIVTMRTTPTVTINNATNFSMTKADATLQACTSFSASQLTPESFVLETIVASGLVAGNATQMLCQNTNATIFVSADF